MRQTLDCYCSAVLPLVLQLVHADGHKDVLIVSLIQTAIRNTFAAPDVMLGRHVVSVTGLADLSVSENKLMKPKTRMISGLD